MLYITVGPSYLWLLKFKLIKTKQRDREVAQWQRLS